MTLQGWERQRPPRWRQRPGGSQRPPSTDGIRFEFYAIDSTGSLFRWTGLDDLFEHFTWETAGQTGAASPVFPVTAWR